LMRMVSGSNIGTNQILNKWSCLMDYKEVMDLWYVWTIGGIIIYKYIKSIIDNWNE